MEETKLCIYCNKYMKYGPYTQVLYKSILKDGKSIRKSVKYILYCWSCKMEDDGCDIVVDDEKNVDINQINLEIAHQALKQDN